MNGVHVSTRALGASLREQLTNVAERRESRGNSDNPDEKSKSLISISMAAKQSDQDRGTILYRIV